MYSSYPNREIDCQRCTNFCDETFGYPRISAWVQKRKAPKQSMANEHR